MTTTYAAESVAEAEVSLVVIRCACGDPMSHVPAVCPQGIEEDLGVVAYYNKSRVKRILWAVRQKFKGLK